MRGNTLTTNTADGIRVEGSSGNRIEANTVSESSGAGVALAASNGNTVTGNTLSANSGGWHRRRRDRPAPVERQPHRGQHRSPAAAAPASALVESTGNDAARPTSSRSPAAAASPSSTSNDTLIRGNDAPRQRRRHRAVRVQRQPASRATTPAARTAPASPLEALSLAQRSSCSTPPAATPARASTSTTSPPPAKAT